jgi:hypothetical protein
LNLGSADGFGDSLAAVVCYLVRAQVQDAHQRVGFQTLCDLVGVCVTYVLALEIHRQILAGITECKSDSRSLAWSWLATPNGGRFQLIRLVFFRGCNTSFNLLQLGL